MKKIDKKLIKLTVLLVVISFVSYFGPEVFRYRKFVSAAGGYSLLPAYNGSVLFPCVLVPPPSGPKCVGSVNCLALDPARCLLHWDVSGAMVGASPQAVLVAKTVAGRIGLTPGASYMGGCNSPMACTAHASFGGGTFGVTKKISDTIDWFTYIIAGKK